VLDLFGGGTETTSTALFWAILFLVNNPDVQETVHKEIENIVGSGRQPLIEHRNNLPYCEAVMNETLRLGNIAPFSLPHTAQEDIVIDGYRIPKGSIVVPSLNSAMHDEKIFPNSNTFDPTRFLDDKGKLIRHENLLAFSLGKYNTVRTMVFNATFTNISAISWRLVLLVEEIEVPGEKHRPVENR
jgi:cytochrome P450